MTPRISTLVAGLWLATLLAPAPASAEQPPAPVSAEREQELVKLFNTAQEHYDQKRYTEALPLFEQVAAELDSPNAMLYVARCLREMGRSVEAYETMQRTLERARLRAATEPRFVKTRDAAQAELAELTHRVGRVTVTVSLAPPGTEIDVAGKTVPADQVVVVRPGGVRIDVRAPGRPPIRRDLDVQAGSEKSVVIDLSAPPPGAAPQPPPEPRPQPRREGGAVRIAGFGVLGLGVAGWVTLIVGGVLSNDRFGEVEARCNQARCTTQADQDLIDDGRNLELAANIGLAVGAAATVAGTFMVIFGGETDAPVVGVQASPVPGGAYLGVTGSF